VKQCRVLVDTVLKLRVEWKVWNILSSWATISFSYKALIREVRFSFARTDQVSDPSQGSSSHVTRLHNNFFRHAKIYKRQCHTLCTMFLFTLWALFWSQTSPRTAGNTERRTRFGPSPETAKSASRCDAPCNNGLHTAHHSSAYLSEVLLNKGSLFPSNQEIPDRQIACVFTELLTPWGETDGRPTGHEIPRVLRNTRFITAFKKALRLFVLWARWIQSTPSHKVLLQSTLILSYLCLSLRTGTSSSKFFERNFVELYISQKYYLQGYNAV
jgi:hypothetical protein